jgi:glutathione S-transferase
MIKLHKFGPAFGMPDSSPFVVKAETYLRIKGLEYEPITADVRKAPRKQLPVVDHDGKIIPDSTAIIDHFEAESADKLDASLDDKQRALGRAFKSMLEEHLYFCILFMRWATDDGWSVFEPSLREMLGKMGVPGLLRGMVSGQARKYTAGRAATQGVGRMPRAEVVAAANGIVDAFSVQLGDGPFLFGDKPTTFDATGYAFTLGVLCPAFDNEVLKHAKTKGNLVAYEKRIKEKYWA